MYTVSFILGIRISGDLLIEAIEIAGLQNTPQDYLDLDFRAACDKIVPDVIANDEIVEAFIHLKSCIINQQN